MELCQRSTVNLCIVDSIESEKTLPVSLFLSFSYILHITFPFAYVFHARSKEMMRISPQLREGFFRSLSKRNETKRNEKRRALLFLADDRLK